MPQSGLDFMNTKEGAHHNTFKDDHPLNGQLPDRRFVNGAVFQHGRSAASETSESSTTGSPDLPKAPCILNGYVNHGYKKKKSTKTAPSQILRTQKSTSSPVSNGSAAGEVADAEVLSGVSASGGTRPDAGNVCSGPERVVADPSSSASKKNQRRKKKFRYKKKKSSAEPQVSLQELEDWEDEVQEVTLKDWEKMCFGVTPYGPEDLIHFTLRGLTLQHSAAADKLETAKYSPAVHHAFPIRWICYSVRSEPDQFANAEL